MLSSVSPWLAQLTARTHSERPQQIRFPNEILYKIVDEVYSTGGARHLKALSATCYVLADYCRPLIFHTTSISSQQSPPAPNYRRLKSFVELVLRSPQTLPLIQHLILDLAIPPPLFGMAGFMPFNPLNPLKEWCTLFTFASKLTELKSLVLAIELDVVPAEVLTSLLKFLMQCTKLRSLTFNVLLCTNQGNACLDTLGTIFSWIPPTVTSLTICRTGHGGPVAHDFRPTTSPRKGPLRLDALTLTSTHNRSSALERVGDEENPWLDLTSLKHLQVGEDHWKFQHDWTHHSFIRPASATLRCLHIPVLSGWMRSTVDRPRSHRIEFPINTLPAIECVEVIAFVQPGQVEKGIGNALDMINHLVGTPAALSAAVSRGVKFIVLARFLDPPNNWELAVSSCQITWKDLSAEGDLWPNLDLLAISGYASASGHEKSPGREEIVRLGAFRRAEQEHALEYEALWENGPCLGWYSV